MNRSKLCTLARRALHVTATLFFSIAAVPTTAITISTSPDPADGWRAIAPVGNLEGQPITAVGLDWELVNADWNTSLAYDDSDAAGWHNPEARDESAYGATLHNNIWVDAEGFGQTPAYFRKQFNLTSLPGAAWIGSNVFNDFSNVVDDDVQIYINGSLVFDDTDGFATFMPVTSVLSYLHEGDNLIAVKAHDSLGGNEHFSMVLQTADVAEPDTLLLALSTAAMLLAFRRRFDRKPVPQTVKAWPTALRLPSAH